MKPRIYLRYGQWTCARMSGVWQVWPYGKGATPLEAYWDWQIRMSGLINQQKGGVAA